MKRMKLASIEVKLRPLYLVSVSVGTQLIT